MPSFFNHRLEQSTHGILPVPALRNFLRQKSIFILSFFVCFVPPPPPLKCQSLQRDEGEPCTEEVSGFVQYVVSWQLKAMGVGTI